MRAMQTASNTATTAIVLVVASMLNSSASASTRTLSTRSLSRASSEASFSVTPMTKTFLVLSAGSRRRISPVPPPLEMRIATSPGCTEPRAPCTASAGSRKKAGRSMHDSEWAILRAAAAEVPTPATATRPVVFASTWTSATKVFGSTVRSRRESSLAPVDQT